MAVEKIAVIRFSSIGDIVLTLPVVHALKKEYPHAEIHFVTKSVFQDLLSGESDIDRFHTLEKGASLRSLRAELQAEKFDLVVDLHDNQRSRFLTFRLNAPVKRYRKDRLRRILYLFFKKREIVTPIWKRYLSAVDNEGVSPDFHLGLSDKSRESVASLLPLGEYLVVAPGSTWATKEWPLAKYEELAAQLSVTSFPIVVVGGAKDRAVQEVFQNTLGERVTPLAGELSISGSAAVVAGASQILTVDTGMMHIASACDIPAVVLFGSTVQEFGFFPASGEAKVLERDLPCRPCSHTGKKACPKKHHNCMNEIRAEDVAALIVNHFEDINA